MVDDSDDREERRIAVLNRMAKALNVPVSTFYASRLAPSDDVIIAELIRLYHTIEDRQQREKLLDLARKFAEGVEKSIDLRPFRPRKVD